MSEKAGRINCYVCPGGHAVFTINVIDGTTSFTIRCMTPGCQKLSQSQMYGVPQISRLHKPEVEWRRPTEEELTDYRDQREIVEEHVKHGGLMPFPVSEDTLLMWAERFLPSRSL